MWQIAVSTLEVLRNRARREMYKVQRSVCSHRGDTCTWFVPTVNSSSSYICICCIHTRPSFIVNDIDVDVSTGGQASRVIVMAAFYMVFCSDYLGRCTRL